MGTWGTTAFEDDTALDIYAEFCSSGQSVQALEESIDKILATTYNMDELLLEGFNEPVKAIVSAEIIAAALGKPVATFPTKEMHGNEVPLLDTATLAQYITPALKEKCKHALAKIATSNQTHLTVLWLESDSFGEWKAYIEDLIKRLN